MADELEESSYKWRVQKFTDNYRTRKNLWEEGQNPVTKTKYRTREAKDFINSYSSRKYKIMEKYQGIPAHKVYAVMSARDRARLQELKQERDRMVSPRRADGSLKDAEEKSSNV
jgi:hypothetical protein